MPIDISFKAASNAATTTYNDQNYINVEGDTLQGDLDLNNHKITNVGSLSDDKDCVPKGYVDNLGIRRNSENDIILEMQGKFILKNPSNAIKFYINGDKIHCNSKRLTDLLPPVNNAYTKDNVDGRITQTISTCVQGTILTIKFDLSRLAPSSVHRLGDHSEQSFFVLAHRFKTRNNLWDTRDQPKVEITVKDNFLHIQKKGLISYRRVNRCR